MSCVVGIDLGSTTTKAVVLDEHGDVLGRGITNSRSNYDLAAAVARTEAFINARFGLIEQQVAGHRDRRGGVRRLRRAFVMEQLLHQLRRLEQLLLEEVDKSAPRAPRGAVPRGASRRSAGASPREEEARFRQPPALRSRLLPRRGGVGVHAHRRADRRSGRRELRPPDRPLRQVHHPGGERAARRSTSATTSATRCAAVGNPPGWPTRWSTRVGRRPRRRRRPSAPATAGRGCRSPRSRSAPRSSATGSGRTRCSPARARCSTSAARTPRRSRWTATGIVTGFQMNDRCAAGCGRYLGYIADEMNLGLHELGPLAEQSQARA